MSDIGLIGIASALGAIATIAVGAIGVLVALVVAIGVRGPRLVERALVFASGPIACTAVGVVGLFTRAEGDAWIFVWPAVGVVSGIVVGVAAKRVMRRNSG